MVEEDSRNLFANKDDLCVISACIEKVNPDSSINIIKDAETQMMDEEQNNLIHSNSQQKQELSDSQQKYDKSDINDINQQQAQEMDIENQVNVERKENQENERDFNQGEEVDNIQQSQINQIAEEKVKAIILQKINRPFNEEEVLKIMKKQDLDEIINLYQYHLVIKENEQQILVENLKKNILLDIVSERIIFQKEQLDLTDILVDIHQYNNIEQEYLNFLENRQQFIDFDAERNMQNQNQTKKHVKSHDINEDLACQICNDGDYTDDDMIVFCAKCNISVHQRCYGIPKIPNDDWICELCLGFGPEGKYLRCALCTQRGGAMKPSKIPITSNIFQNTNTSYYEFQKTCKAGPPNKKQKYENLNERQPKIVSSSKQIIQEDEEIQDENESDESQYYDYHELKEFTEEELKNEPKPYFFWCHITCALWTPECFFDDKNYYTNVKGIENIEKQRYRLECSICKQKSKKAGSCIQCAKTKCMEAFHPECARRSNLFMEQRNTDKLPYIIYCERHTPLKLRRHLEQKEKKYKDEIIKFCKCIEKSREYRKKERNQKKESDRQLEKDKKKPFEKKKILISAKKIRQQITKNQEESQKEEIQFQQMLINKMIEYIDNLKLDEINKTNENFDNNIVEASSENKDETKINQIQEETTPNNGVNSKSTKKNNFWQNNLFMKKEDPFWKEISYKSLSNNQIFKRYKKIQRDKIKKKEFKQLYFKTLHIVKNIRIYTKEERLIEKEKKKLEKQQKRQQKIQEIFQKTQEKEKKRLEIQQIKDQKEAYKKEKETKFELSKKAIRRTNKKNDKIKDKKQSKLTKQNKLIEQEKQIQTDYEPVDDKLYCICRRKYQEEDSMMACEKCDEWYHFECVGFEGTGEQAQNIEFVCKFCDFKDTDLSKRKERKDCYGNLFLQYDEPNYDFLKDLTNKKIKTEQNDLENTQEGSEIQSEKSIGKKRNSYSKKSQKVKKKQNSNKQQSEDQSSSSQKQSEENSKSPEFQLSTVKEKLDYQAELQEKFEEGQNENFEKSNEIQQEDDTNSKLQNEESFKKNGSHSKTNQSLDDQTNSNKIESEDYSLLKILDNQISIQEQTLSSKENDHQQKMEQEIEDQQEIKQEELKNEEYPISDTENTNKIQEHNKQQSELQNESEIQINQQNQTKQLDQEKDINENEYPNIQIQ